jgi:hypothetical protein
VVSEKPTSPSCLYCVAEFEPAMLIVQLLQCRDILQPSGYRGLTANVKLICQNPHAIRKSGRIGR